MRKLYLFNNSIPANEGWNSSYSMADDGTVLGNHLCSHDVFMYHDLYVRSDRKKTVDEHFKDEPYEVEIIPSHEVKTHPGLQEAFKLNQIAGEKAKQEEINNA